MPFTEEERRERKNARQREYAKRTGYAANKRYAATHENKFVMVSIKLHEEKDADVIDKLKSVPNRADYIRGLVRNDVGSKDG